MEVKARHPRTTIATSDCTVRMSGSSRESSLDTSESDYLKNVDREHHVDTLMRICTVLHCLHFCAPRLRSSFLVIVELLFRFHKNRSPYQCQSACNRTCLERSTLDIPRRANTRPRADVAMYIRGHCSVCRFQLLNFFMFPPSHPCLWATGAYLQVWLFSVQWAPSTLLRTSDQW